MKTDTVKLLKHFATVFRSLANGTEQTSINPLVLRYLSRAELIEIITSPSFVGSNNVKEIDLLKMENEELLSAIGNELHIIAHLTAKWCEDGIPVTENPASEKKPPASHKAKSDGKK